MKKLIPLFLMLVLAATFTLAYGHNVRDDLIIPSRDVPTIRERSNVSGLENAILNVRNQEQKDHLKSVLSMINEKQKERLQKLNNLVITEQGEGYEAVGRTPAKFLGLLPFNKQVKYTLRDDGSMIYVPSPWDGLFVFNEPGVIG